MDMYIRIDYFVLENARDILRILSRSTRQSTTLTQSQLGAVIQDLHANATTRSSSDEQLFAASDLSKMIYVGWEAAYV